MLLEFYTYVIRSVLLNHMNESYRANHSAVPDFILSMRKVPDERSQLYEMNSYATQ